MRYILVAFLGALAYVLFPVRLVDSSLSALPPIDILRLMGTVISGVIAIQVLIKPSKQR